MGNNCSTCSKESNIESFYLSPKEELRLKQQAREKTKQENFKERELYTESKLGRTTYFASDMKKYKTDTQFEDTLSKIFFPETTTKKAKKSQLEIDMTNGGGRKKLMGGKSEEIYQSEILEESECIFLSLINLFF